VITSTPRPSVAVSSDTPALSRSVNPCDPSSRRDFHPVHVMHAEAVPSRTTAFKDTIDSPLFVSMSGQVRDLVYVCGQAVVRTAILRRSEGSPLPRYDSPRRSSAMTIPVYNGTAGVLSIGSLKPGRVEEPQNCIPNLPHEQPPARRCVEDRWINIASIEQVGAGQPAHRKRSRFIQADVALLMALRKHVVDAFILEHVGIGKVKGFAEDDSDVIPRVSIEATCEADAPAFCAFLHDFKVHVVQGPGSNNEGIRNEECICVGNVTSCENRILAFRTSRGQSIG